MEILNARRFNEKLNIQPITKERLKNAKMPKMLLQSGDFIVMDLDFSPSTNNVEFVYISKEDFDKHYYFEWQVNLVDEKYLEGVFVAYSRKHTKYVVLPLSLFNNNLVDDKSYTPRKVMSIYRGEYKQPYPSKFFSTPPIESKTVKLIWQRNK